MSNSKETLDENGRSELHIAAYHQDYDWVVRCVEGGFDINLKDNGGWSPIVWAIDMCCTSEVGVAEKIIEYLVNKGADLDIGPFSGESLTEFAQGINSEIGIFVEKLLQES